MHECSLGNSHLVNAEVDSMGEVVESGVGFGVASSSAFEKAQADLRREYDVREKRRRELEFLEKGGNPLDFNFGNAASVSVQSTSLTDQLPEQLVTSEAKGSFAITASPHGDSAESTGRPEAHVVSETNYADNILLFNGKNDSVDGGKNSVRFVRSKISPPEQISPLNSSQNAKESDESAILGLPKSQAYKRRNRSRPNREGARLSSTDMPSLSGQKDAKDSILDSNLKPVILNGIIAPNDLPSDGAVDMILENGQEVKSFTGPTEIGLPKVEPNGEKKLVSSQRSEDVASEILESIDGRQMVVSPRLNSVPLISEKTENQTGFVQQNGFVNAKGDEERVLKKGQITCRIPSNGIKDEEDIKENTGEEKIICQVSPSNGSDVELKTLNENKSDDRYSTAQDEESSVCKNNQNDSSVRPEKVQKENGSGLQEGEKACSGRLGVSADKSALDNLNTEKENVYTSPHDPSVSGLLPQIILPSRESSDTNNHRISTEAQLKLEVKSHEDSILKEARIIEAKRKRIAQLSVRAFISESHQKSHWDFVLEEMTWLANDFAQERLWKISAAAQLSHRIASTCRERLAEKSSLWEQKKVAHTLSKAIAEFWFSAEELSKGKAIQCPTRNSVRGVRDYAARFLNYNNLLIPSCLAEAPVTPERILDLGSQELSWDEQFTEENLFYTVPPGAMDAYRKAIESHLARIEKTGSGIHEEVETSTYDVAAGNTYQENKGETNTYLQSGDVESGKPQKKRILIKSSSARSYDMGTDFPFTQRVENKFKTQQSGLIVKRPVNNFNASSIPTKRMRTASRPRFTAGTSAGIQVLNKTDASSGDTNSFDDQSIFHGGSEIPNNMEVENVGDFGRQLLPFDSAEVSKPKKKKKQKHLGTSYEQRWQLENNFQNEPGGYSRKRFDNLAESNGSSGLFGQHIMKKQKMMRQPMENSLDNYSPVAGSIPSPVASQMSNMSNSNKLVKILCGHRGRKSKSFKMPVGQTGPGSPWSSFEEQALIVLVHDFGPNWELISDAINNILQYKCIFRKPKDCNEHHKELISRTAGDGAESAEDSGSSQPYSSTLPGIRKGSARTLFQRLQEPIEEDMIKFHFEKIIAMSQKLHYLKMQNENQEQKPIQPHSSHALALSQVCPNNVNGGPILTPLDLCDEAAPSTDVLSSGLQGTNGTGLGIPNNANSSSLHSTSGANSSLHGSPSVAYGNNFPSPSTPVSSLIRDGRYNGPRSVSSLVDEHHRVQQYNQMTSGRVSGTPSGTDRGVLMMPGGNGMGIMYGINKNNKNTARPGFPGISPPSVLNSSSMVSPNMAGPANIQSGVGVGPANSMLRARAHLNMMRPAHIIPEHRRQIMVPDVHTEAATQGNISSFRGPIGNFSKQPSPPSTLSHPFHPHNQGPNHAPSPRNQAYSIPFAKERQLQLQHHQRLLQQQQLASSNGMMPRGPPHDSSPQTSTSVSTPLTPSSSPMPIHELTKNTKNIQTGKQIQRQPKQKPQNHNAKFVKGAGRGDIAINKNLASDALVSNGFSPVTASQFTEKAEQVANMMKGEGLYPGSGLNHHHPLNKPLVQHHKLYSGQAISSSKQAQQLPSQGNASPSISDNNNNPLFISHQAASPSATSSSNSKLANRSQVPTSGTLGKPLEQQISDVPKPVAQSAPEGNELTSSVRDQIQGSEVGQVSINLPNEVKLQAGDNNL